MKLYKKALKSFLTYCFKSMGYLPRWVIFYIDVLILILSGLITYTLVSNLTTQSYPLLSVPQRYGFIVVVNGIYFLIFKTYSGIIRLSTFIDGMKLLLSTTCAFLTVLTVNYLTFFTIGQKIYVVPGLFINYVISFVLLFLFRIVVKDLFEYFKSISNENKKLRAVIYGSVANSIFVANALKLEYPSRFELVAFINRTENNKSKTIFGLPILSAKKKLPVLLRAINADAVILADELMDRAEKMEIIDSCLEFNFQVFVLPAISNWQNPKEISNKVKKIQIEDLLERSPIVLDNTSISLQIKSKTVLITGAAGSIGSEIVRQIIAFNPERIILVDQAETPLHHLSLELSNSDSNASIHALIADIRDYEILSQIFEKYNPSIVYHAAAYKHVPLMEENPSQAIFTNIKGTKNVADLSLRFHVEKFVMISTDKAVNPSNIMGASKRIAEKYVQSLSFKSLKKGGNSTKFITTRFGNVLGSNGSVVPLFTKQIASGGPVTITHQDIIRYFMTIPEACQLVLEAGAMGNGGEIFIFDMGEPVRIKDLAIKMIKLAGFIPDKDIFIKIVGLRPGEKLYEELLNDTSKTLPTHHNKIMIAQELEEDSVQLHSDIEILLALANDIELNAIVSKMKEIVPEFKSLNSVYEKLDLN